ncbi:MAG: energy-coupling factor transporter transmembrane protein EcfT [Spirochaetaceae bacterium]|nr:energy-coupling factor transporter transmembrane protein EcfT [Spirochaetaceae bacterium]
MGQFHRAGGGIGHFERLGLGDSLIHGLHPAAKGIVTLGYIVTVVSVPPASLSALVPFLFYPVLAASVSGAPWKLLFARLAPVLPFVLFFALSNLMLMREPAFTLSVLGAAFTVTRGMVFFAAILLKTTFTVIALLLLMATTPFYEIAECITAPPAFRVFGLQIILTMRYITTLLDEAEAMWTAYALRSPGAKALRMKDMGPFMGRLLLRSFDRAERVFCAMKCRGFAGVYRGAPRKCFTQTAAGVFTPVNLAYVALSLAVFGMLRLCNVSVALGKLFL